MYSPSKGFNGPRNVSKVVKFDSGEYFFNNVKTTTKIPLLDLNKENISIFVIVSIDILSPLGRCCESKSSAELFQIKYTIPS